MKRILFLVNGYGLGNSTRIHGIIQNIPEDYLIDILADGNSLRYFKQVSRVSSLFQCASVEYGIKNGKIDFWMTIGKMFENLKAIYKNHKVLKKILKSHNYQLIVSDSHFSTFFLKNRPKLISLNNSDVIVKRAVKIKKRGAYIQFFIEFLDYLYNLCVPDLVISPFFEPLNDSRHIRHTAGIVRQEFRRLPLVQPFKSHHILIMTGGASHLNQDIIVDFRNEDCVLSVLEGNNQIYIEGRVQREKKTFDASSLMNQATIVVINGGFSSISEALALAKPMIIVPATGHMEQKVNALWVENNHFGIISSWKDIKKSIKDIKGNYAHFKKALLSYNCLQGAQQAASLILKEI